jgi:hypothetical protein
MTIVTVAGSLLLAVLPIAVVVWLAVDATTARTAAAMRRLPARPARDRLERPRWRLLGLRITEVVIWREDVLVGGDARWPGGSRQLLLASAGRDPAARRRLDQWALTTATLTGVVSHDGRLVALVHERSRHAVVARA